MAEISTIQLTALFSLSDVSNASPSSSSPKTGLTNKSVLEEGSTPILKLVDQAHKRGFDNACLPLTTEKWQKRWEEMCLAPTPGPAGSSMGINVDVAPEILAKKKRESRRESRFFKARDVNAEKKAEQWRANPVFQPDEVTMMRLDETENVCCLVSEWLELDAEDEWVRHDTEIALQQELAYASYLNITTAVLPSPKKTNRDHVASYARAVNACLSKNPFLNLSVRLPIYDPSTSNISALRSSTVLTPSSTMSSIASGDSSPTLKPPGTPKLVVSNSDSSIVSSEAADSLDAMWEMWDLIRSICDYHPRLTLALDLAPPLPTTIGVLKKWSAEAVKYIFIPASTFIANGKGYPVLPKPTQAFLRDSMAHQPTIVLSGTTAGLHTRGGEAAYAQYVRHIERTSPTVQAYQRQGTVENFAQGYQDYLQAPLQPLRDNLLSMTYHTFEQDPVKYQQYEEAMCRALERWPGDDIVIICVVGAGRGPLIARCLSAIERSKRDAFVYAVEKNPNAYVTLQKRKQTEWGDKVNLIFGDMRSVDVPEKADIVVSELLGSFGDNELSPECLDGAMRFLKPGGISIPASYTAHLAPLSSSKLYHEARAVKDPTHLETPYVVMFQNVNILSGDDVGFVSSGRCGPQIQECWEFEHPKKDMILDERGVPLTNTHNARAAKLNFFIPHAGVLHGLAGYFEAVLYENIGVSIHPHRKEQVSPDMLSWFPLFFPFRDPLYLPSDSELQVSIWRMTNEQQVWYEWHAESFLTVHNTPTTHQSPVSVTAGGVNGGAASPPLFGAASPLVDADVSMDIKFARALSQAPEPLPVFTTVKIGQTSLHNPGGRSSWIGL